VVVHLSLNKLLLVTIVPILVSPLMRGEFFLSTL
jgi:hypothetical protein